MRDEQIKKAVAEVDSEEEVRSVCPDAECRSGLSLFPADSSMRFLSWVFGTVGGRSRALGCGIRPDVAWEEALESLRNR